MNGIVNTFLSILMFFVYMKKGFYTFSWDMRKEYVSMAKSLFPNASIVIDRFHVARYGCWAFENVRKRVQKKFGDKYRKYFKHSRKLLLKRKDDLTEEGKDQVAIMLGFDKELAEAY